MPTGKTTRPRSSHRTAAKRPGVRELAAQATRDSILRAATKVFARYGYAGGSVEKISKAAKSFDRMIYYYFGNKEGLFIAVLEESYRRFNDAQSALSLNAEQPIESLTTVVRFIINYYRDNPEFVTLLNTENLHRGRHIAGSSRAQEYSLPAIGILDQLLQTGASKNVFRPDVAGRDLYLMIAALGYFYQSNRFTLSAFLGENLQAPEAFEHWQSFAIETVLRTVSPVDRAVAKAA